MIQVNILLDKYSPDQLVAPFQDFTASMYDSDLVVADMHDGDQKAITFQSCECTVPCECTMTIKPHANNQTWQVQVVHNYTSCQR